MSGLLNDQVEFVGNHYDSKLPIYQIYLEWYQLIWIKHGVSAKFYKLRLNYRDIN